MPAKPPESDDALKRERAGTYRTRDGRFSVEQTSSGWLLLDAEQTDGLGLPLARGPFATLDAARDTIPEARTASAPDAGPKPRPLRTMTKPAAERTGRANPAIRRAAARAPKDTVVIRDIRAVDGDALRALWTEIGFGLLGDDDLGLARMARRNPGLVLVASVGSRVVGSALGAWDGRRGWIYHVAVASSHRRQGIATRMIDQVETGLRALGCRKVNVMIRPTSDGGEAFWSERGYTLGPAQQFGLELRDD